ncbi:MAG: amidohydrolase family protein, partial [Deltaproteobacteria bacterium]|nr:amidohydrolase family protein [Deltaproteobacteria bacterium]
GLMDFHVHLDDFAGGFPIADDFGTGSRAAILNGVTTLFSFATQRKNEGVFEAVNRMISKGSGKSFCDFSLHTTPISFEKKDWNEIEGLIEMGFMTFKFYTTYKESGLYMPYERLAGIFRRLASRGAVSLVHCEDHDVLDRALSPETDFRNPYSHTFMRPEKAEVEGIRKVTGIARETCAKAHIVHVSTPEGLRLIKEARKESDITCETAPHYLFLNDDCLKRKNGHRFLCAPPLRSERARDLMESEAAHGSFDTFATDHCPFSKRDKDSNAADIRKIPNGLAGTGSLFPMIYELLVKRHGKGLSEIAKRLSENPAKIAGIYPKKGTIRKGSDADLVIVRQEGAERPVVSSLSDVYETFEGFVTGLDFRYVLLRGDIVVKDNVIVDAKKPSGECLWKIL